MIAICRLIDSVSNFFVIIVTVMIVIVRCNVLSIADWHVFAVERNTVGRRIFQHHNDLLSLRSVDHSFADCSIQNRGLSKCIYRYFEDTKAFRCVCACCVLAAEFDTVACTIIARDRFSGCGLYLVLWQPGCTIGGSLFVCIVIV
jgi:hypothetical protein